MKYQNIEMRSYKIDKFDNDVSFVRVFQFSDDERLSYYYFRIVLVKNRREHKKFNLLVHKEFQSIEKMFDTIQKYVLNFLYNQTEIYNAKDLECLLKKEY